MLRCAALAVLGCLVAACSPDPNLQELVKEMRAERLQRRSAGTVEDPQALARALVEQAMAPLRDVLVQLDERQGELAQRQAALAGELREWTRLAVDATNQQQGAQAKSLQLRLAELEETIQAQRARQGEMEAVIGEALTRTATQLEQFLQRLRASGQPAPSAPEAGAGKTEPPPAGVGSEGPGGDEEDRRQAGLWPIWAVAIGAIGAGTWLLLPKRGAQPSVPPGRWQSSGEAVDEHELDPAELQIADVAEPAEEVQELWDTAAMLGEAVGRLREERGDVVSSPASDLERSAPASDAPAPTPLETQPVARPAAQVEASGPAPADSTRHSTGKGAAPLWPPLPAEGPETVRPLAPGSVVCHVPAGDPASVEGDLRDLLRQDRRVLATPAPEVQRVGGGLQVAFATLPDLQPGERALLEQRVRELGRRPAGSRVGG